MTNLQKQLLAGVCALSLFGVAACDSETDQKDAANTPSAEQPAAQQPAKQAAKAEIIPPQADPASPVTQPPYPDRSVELGEEGQVLVKVTVDTGGDVTAAAIERSSGYKRLDMAALREAEDSWRFKPGTINGKPSPMTHTVAVTYELEER